MKSKKTRWLKRTLLLVLVLGTGIGYGGWYLSQPAAHKLDIETEPIKRGGLTQMVTASGQLNPLIKVEVGSQISGIIQSLLVDFNSTVKQGQLIAQIDPAGYQASLMQAEGNLANAQAAADLARLNAERAKSLQDQRLNPKAEYEKALADLRQAEAAVKISQGALKKAQVDLARCTIYAPIDGVVISRDVNVGQTVAASLSAPKLYLIANDLTQMQIEAKVSEADIGRIQVGQAVKFTVDAFPEEKFRGKVTQVRNAPVLDSTVVMYDTIIEVHNPELKLKPGMTANVTIIIAEREDVLKIPNAALRFRPPKDVEVVKASPGEAAPEEKKAPDSKSKKSKKKSGKVVYGLRNGVLHALEISLGISDGRESEVLAGLKEGDEVIVDMAEAEQNERLMSRLLSVIKRKD